MRRPCLRRLGKMHQPRYLAKAPGETPCRPSSGAGGKKPPTSRWCPHGFGAEAGRIPGGGASRTTRRRGLRRGRRGGAASSASASCQGRRTLEGQLDPGRQVLVDEFQGTSSMDRAGGRGAASCDSRRRPGSGPPRRPSRGGITDWSVASSRPRRWKAGTALLPGQLVSFAADVCF